MFKAPAPIPYGKQSISLSDRLSVFRALGSRNLTQGPRIEAFEERFTEITGTKFAVAFSSGTAALHAASVVSRGKTKQKDYTTPLTFVATVNSIIHGGGNPILGDIDRDSWNLDLKGLPHPVDRVMSVDFAGLPHDLTLLRGLGTKGGPVVIQDCAHSLGGSTPSGPVGSGGFSTVSCFSLHPVKAITTGEGGVATTDNQDVAAALQEFRSHGIARNVSHKAWEYDARSSGFNYRLTDFQAQLGISQLVKLRGFIEERNEIADRYRVLLGDTPLGLPPAAKQGFVHAYHLFPVLFRDENQRERAFNFLRASGVIVQVHYRPIFHHTRYKNIDRLPGGLPVAEDVMSRILSLPIFPGLKKSVQKRIAELVKVASTL